MCFLNQLINQPLKKTRTRDTVRGNALNQPKQPIHEMGESFYQKSEMFHILVEEQGSMDNAFGQT